MLDVPAEYDLGRSDAMGLCDPNELRVAQVHRLERAVPLELHTPAAVRLEDPPVEERRAPFDLVDRGQAAGCVLELVELSNRVVAYSYLAREPFRLQLEQPFPYVRSRESAGRPVDEPQVDVAEPERVEAVPECRPLTTCSARRRFVVTKISSRDTPLSAMACPTCSSFPYAVAVSMCR